MQTMSLSFPFELWGDVVAHLSGALPNEACGFLAGRSNVVTRVYPVENALQSPTAYRMDPVSQILAMRAIDEAGLDLIGIYHSHPQGPLAPSPTDLREAAYPDVRYVICAPRDDGWDARAFWLRDGRATEEPVAWGSFTGDRGGDSQ